jgi:hypothetical protein
MNHTPHPAVDSLMNATLNTLQAVVTLSSLPDQMNRGSGLQLKRQAILD